jgi:UrcA family protein
MFDKRFFGTNARLSLAVAAAFIAIAPLGSQAADQETGKSVHVKVSDLNLNSDAGAYRLYRRIESAAYEVCDSQRNEIDVVIRGGGPCVRQTIAHTVHDLGIASLARVYIHENSPALARQFDISDEVITAKN